jgi:hypothetical protein
MIPPETLSWLIEVLGPDVEVAEDPLPDTSHTNHRIRAGDREMLLRRFTDAELLGTMRGTRPPTRSRRSRRSGESPFRCRS